MYDLCDKCGDLKDDLGMCFTCRPVDYSPNRRFVWEYAFESITEQGHTQFWRVMPDED